MTSILLSILDPEFVVPSDTAKEDLEFWIRMDNASKDPEPRLGPSTLKALHQLLLDPPQVNGLSTGDFWGIVGKYVQRGIPPAPESRPLCEEHIRSDYHPAAGALSNLELLVDDLYALGDRHRAALYTRPESWQAPDRECRKCEESRLSVLTSGDDLSWDAKDKAAVARIAYLEETPTDLLNIEGSASVLFPALEFASDAWRSIRTLSGGAEENVKKLIVHLGVLNDFAASVWGEDSSTEGRQARLAARGVTSSPESPQTHRNRRAMRMRDFSFKTGIVRCEWHTKLRPDVNRIHFAVDGDCVMIGAILNHLPT